MFSELHIFPCDFRKCQLITTGPWREVPNLALIDMSLQVDVDPNFDGPIALWAVGANGDVVTRMGVTTEIPQVSQPGSLYMQDTAS